MKQMANQNKSERSFEGDQVYLKVKIFQQQLFSTTTTSKLSPKYYESFAMMAKVGERAYRLQLSEWVKRIQSSTYLS